MGKFFQVHAVHRSLVEINPKGCIQFKKSGQGSGIGKIPIHDRNDGGSVLADIFQVGSGLKGGDVGDGFLQTIINIQE